MALEATIVLFMISTTKIKTTLLYYPSIPLTTQCGVLCILPSSQTEIFFLYLLVQSPFLFTFVIFIATQRQWRKIAEKI